MRIFNKYYVLIVSLIGIGGLAIFREKYIVFAIVCFMVIIFNDGIEKTKIRRDRWR